MVLPGSAVFPSETCRPGTSVSAREAVFAETMSAPADVSTLGVCFPDREALQFRLGLGGSPTGQHGWQLGNRSRRGTVFATSGFDPLPTAADRARQSLAGGRPLPLGGASFGVGVLATPTGSVGGQSINPLVDRETSAILRRHAGRGLLRQAGVTDTTRPAWRAESQRVRADADHLARVPDRMTLLETDTALEIVLGIVRGEDGPWGTFLVVARITVADHVMAVVAITRPVAPPGAVGDLTLAHFGTRTIVSHAVTFAREAIASLR